MEIKYITVAALNRYIQYKFESDVNLQLIYLKAEISNVRLSKGILYFVLKDEESEIDAIMFQSQTKKISFNIVDGMKVLVSGKVSVYQKRGRYSFNVLTMEEAGLGDAYLEFLRLKDSLAQEGLFDQDKKLKIPSMSENIGIITSATGDALHDIVTTIERRFPIAKLYLYSALVQGAAAPKSLIKALKTCIKDKLAEVIIIARGGGTIEDLSCFNDEALAREIFASPVPTVSGVGHEQDYTICDFVASLRAPTPTGAAVAITKDKTELLAVVNNSEKQIVSFIKHKLLTSFNKYQAINNTYAFKNYISLIEKNLIQVSELSQRLQMQAPIKLINTYEDRRVKLENSFKREFESIIENKNKKLELIVEKLIILNPLNLMKKGYAITYQEKQLISSVKNIKKDKNLRIIYIDGELETKINSIKEKEE